MLRRSCGPVWRPFRFRRLPIYWVQKAAYHLGMSAEKNGDRGSRRLKELQRVLDGVTFHRKLSSSEVGEWLSIGDVKAAVCMASNPELVPRFYAESPLSQITLQHLKWMLQKDALGQDMFLLGSPGPYRRHLAMAFCELTGREVEYVSLSRDTTETDLKQRREIINSTVHYIDQCAVEACLKGRVLVLDGIEKAERNVLPVLNNLLENREMQLDDGRLIVDHIRYDRLREEHGEDALSSWNIARAHDKFRVIALGLPVPPYKGNPLDPPLRSRFQARTIFQTPFQNQLDNLRELCPGIDDQILSSLLSVSFAINSLSHKQLSGGPVDLAHQIPHICTALNSIPEASVTRLLQTVYPSELLGTEGLLKEALNKFGLSDDRSERLMVTGIDSSVGDVVQVSLSSQNKTQRLFQKNEGIASLVVSGWTNEANCVKLEEESDFVTTKSHEQLLADMIISHHTADFCLVGAKGTGKTSLVSRFAALLGYEVEPITLYQDMTSRDLLQQRTTLSNGDTSWRVSPLITAARHGRLAVLDGLHRVDTGTLTVLKSFIQDRSLHLMDGTRLLSQHCYEAAKTAAKLSDIEMSQRNIFPVHPKFRMVGVGETMKSSGSSQAGGSGSAPTPSLASWISPELLSMFQFHHVKPLPVIEERHIIQHKVPAFSKDQLDLMLKFVHSLRSSKDPTLQSLSSSVSTRQLLRISKRLSCHPSESLYQAINKACLSRFLPQLTKSALQQALKAAGIHPPSGTDLEQQLVPIQCEVKNGVLHIGSTHFPVSSDAGAAAMVPNVLFYDNQLHLRIMEDMLRDYALGEHLLLVGNQGVGKNKIVDRFLHLLNLPREYLQLHRDSTVQTLTLQPSVQSGRVIYQDSPLVRALVSGMVLVVDEADKAPTHVTCILKNIVEGSEITLADGRRIVHRATGVRSDDTLLVHPNFRMIVLANRPGFPFLGNDFFASLGDIFSCHAVDNPDLQSEKAMLQRYGSSVSDAILTKLVMAFSELRQFADEGLIAYPYSTREVVNIVKHLEAFPSEGIGSVVRNVFDFDSFNEELLQVVLKVLHKHGIPAGASRTNIQLAPQYPLMKPELVGKWNTLATSNTQPLYCLKLPVNLKGPYNLKSLSVPVDRVDSRGHAFSEMKCYCSLPLHETNRVVGVCSTLGNDGAQYLQAVTDNPFLLYSLPLEGNNVACLSLDDMFPALLGQWSPQVKVGGLSGNHRDKCLIYEQQTGTVLLVQPLENRVWSVKTDSLSRSVRDIMRFRQQSSKNTVHQFCQGGNNQVIMYKDGSSELTVLDFSEECPTGYSVSLPTPISSIISITSDQWIATTDQKKYYLIDDIRTKPSWKELEVNGNITPVDVRMISADALPEKLCKGSEFLSPDTHLVAGSNGKSMATVIKHIPLDNVGAGVYSLSDKNTLDNDTTLVNSGESNSVILSEVGVVCYPASVKTGTDHGLLVHEPGVVLVDVPHNSWRKIVLPVMSQSGSLHRHRNIGLQLAALDNATVAAVDTLGTVRVIEVDLATILSSLDEWQKMVGEDENKELQITHSRDSGLDVSSPKHGKVDEKNAPHVGGSTWAGGTGGRDTAGLGGKGGPYRLDAGHDVYQLSDEEKNSVPEDVKQKAREMGRKAYQERLREIQMSEHDADMYARIVGKVKSQIQALRVMLSSIEAKNKERQWIRHQTSGDLDERKLIDGLTGERSIYKRRGEKEPDFNTDHVYPTRVRLVVDVSGSMYRFNGYDGRLDRTIEAVLMVMEACQNINNVKIDIVGHSGDSDEIAFVNSNNPPSNDKERLQVLKSMIAESQFCWSGDHTIEATRTAVEHISQTKADQKYVVVLSDANFSRYGIKPSDFSKLMFADQSVKVYAIFIGSLGDQAARLKSSLPAGSSYICMDNKDLPNILKSILSSIN